MSSDFLTVLCWSLIASFDESEQLRLVQQPCLFDYDNFCIQKSFSSDGRYYPKDGRGKGWPFQIRSSNNDELQLSVGGKSVSICINDKGLTEIVFLNNGKPQKNKKIKCLMSSVPEITKITGNFLFDGEFKSHLEDFNSEIANVFTDVVLDLSSTRPCYIENSGAEKYLPFRLVRQYWPTVDHGKIYVDCGVAKAIKLSSDIATISILDIFSNKKDYSSALLSSAAVGFSQKLSKFFGTEKLVYLVPDSINEFSLESLRKSINFYFPDSIPLPRSIAAVFDWQNSKNFSKSGFNNGDIVVVIDRSVDGISMTPLAGYKSFDLEDFVPVSNGVYWERHPTTILEIDNPCAAIVERTLAEDGCYASEEIAALIDVDEILNESAPISWVGGVDQWYDVSQEASESISQLTSAIELPWDEIRSNAEVLFEGYENKIYILTTDGRFQKSSICKPFIWVDSSVSLVSGGQTLSRWQVKAGEVPLWKDHLPDLSFKIPVEGRWGQFDVVKGAKVTPKRGKSVQVPVERPFTLPAGQSHFSFQLLQGSRGQALKYMAYLKSPAFPLPYDTVCTLRMIYTYGADDPYQLEFIPNNLEKAGFKSVRVEWRELDNNPFDLSYPSFPQVYPWNYLEHYPKRNSSETSNLLEWLSESIDFFPRFETWINKGEFVFEGTITDEGILAVTTSEKLQKSIRFPVFTIWNQGHSLSDPEIPDWFKRKVQVGIEWALKLLKWRDSPKELKVELLFFLCGLHQNAPDLVPRMLLATFDKLERLEEFYKHIAIAIGDCSLGWQKKLLNKSISILNSENRQMSELGLQILGLALWRSESLIYRLSFEELKILLESTLNSLEDSFSDLHAKFNSYDFNTPFQIIKLELVLALIRTRSFDDDNVKRLLLPQNGISERLVSIIDEFVQEISCKGRNFRSFVRLQVDKPPAFYKTPDLLYAIRMYLTGDSGANSIQVTGVSYQD